MIVSQATCNVCKALVLAAHQEEGAARYYNREATRMLVVVGVAELAGRRHPVFGPCQKQEPLYAKGSEPYEYFGHAIHRCAK